MKKIAKKPLHLTTQQIRVLADASLSTVAGGIDATVYQLYARSSAQCDTVGCPTTTI